MVVDLSEISRFCSNDLQVPTKRKDLEEVG